MTLPTRAAQGVIDQALRENAFGERLCYGLAITTVLVGSFVLIFGALHGNELVALAGALASSLIFPALKYAMQIRQQNLSIRLMEVVLDRAETSADAAASIRKVFEDIWKDDTSSKNAKARG